MKNIHDIIFSKYDVDIDDVNIIDLYKIESKDIEEDELNAKINERKEKWIQSINGTNEKFAQRDKIYLDKSHVYENILKNNKIRNQIYDYYKSKDSKSNEDVKFAKEFLNLVGTTKKIKQNDADFFIKYFENLKKSNKEIIEIFKKDYRIYSNSNVGNFEDKDFNNSDKKKNIICNAFKDNTIFKVHKCDICFAGIKNIDGKNMYDYLELDTFSNIKDFKEYISKKRDDTYVKKQEKGIEYANLLDFYNLLNDVLKNKDVMDNFVEFKLLLKYPKLMPYMYCFEDMKKETLEQFFIIAQKEYHFRSMNEFIMYYFKIIYDNFNINDTYIKGLLKQTKTVKKQNFKLHIPILLKLVYVLLYWPIYICFSILEIVKIMFNAIHRFIIPISIGICVISNFVIPHIFKINNLLVLGKIFNKSQWYSYVNSIMHKEMVNGYISLLLSIVVILIVLTIYIIPTILISSFLYESTCAMDIDWKGIERTFQLIFETAKKRLENEFYESKQKFIRKKAIKVLLNFICLGIVCMLIIFVPKGAYYAATKMGYVVNETEIKDKNIKKDNKKNTVESTKSKNKKGSSDKMIIIENEANIRSGPGTNNDIVQVVNKNDVFVKKGKKKVNGTVWYEIYLNKKKTSTGWASEKVIKNK